MPVVHASALAGACAGLVSSILTCPLDVVKTRLQAAGALPAQLCGAPNFGASGIGGRGEYARPQPGAPAPPQRVPGGLNVGAVLRKIWHEDGPKGFYRGLGPTIFGYLPTWAIYFTVYDACKSGFARRENAHDDEFLVHIASAMTAGAASTCCTSPLWVVKTRFMLQSTKDSDVRPYRHTGDAFVQIWRTEGFRGFYRGLLPSLFGVSHVAIQFPLYEQFKSWTMDRAGTDELQPSVILMCSSSAKMIASVLTYPHEVLRTRLQMQPRLAAAAQAVAEGTPAAVTPPPSAPTRPPGRPEKAPGRAMHTLASTPRVRAGGGGSPHSGPGASRGISHMGNKGNGGRYSGVLHACATIAREEGIRGFYRGMGVNLVRTVPSSALTILTYEVMMQHLTAGDDDGDAHVGDTTTTTDGGDGKR